MRTTILLPDALFREAKKVATESGTTLTRMIADALRETLFRRRRKPQPKRTKLTTFGSGGLQPGVDLNNNAALLELMESYDGRNGR